MAALVGVPMGLLDLVGGGTGAGCGAASAPTSGTPQPAHMSKMEARVRFHQTLGCLVSSTLLTSTARPPPPPHGIWQQAAQDDNNNATLLALNRAQEKATQDLRKEHAELTAALAKEKDRAQRLAASEGHLRVRLKNLEAQRGTTDSRVENLTARFRVRACDARPAPCLLPPRVARLTSRCHNHLALRAYCLPCSVTKRRGTAQRTS